MEIENIIVDIFFALTNITIGFFLGWHYCKKGMQMKLEEKAKKQK